MFETTSIDTPRPRRSRRRGIVSLLVAGAVLLGALSTAQAALTTGGCLAQKRKAWAGLRKCQGTEEAKQLQGKTGDLAKCQTKFDDKLTKISEKASASSVACRYGDNEDGTVTDYDTGLQWEQKTDDSTVHDKDNSYTWTLSISQPDGTAFTAFLGTLNNGTSYGYDVGSPTSGCFAGHCDWRLPAIAELKGIVDLTQGNCGGGAGPCIDQAVFGPTVANLYWSASTPRGDPRSLLAPDRGLGHE